MNSQNKGGNTKNFLYMNQLYLGKQWYLQNLQLKDVILMFIYREKKKAQTQGQIARYIAILLDKKFVFLTQRLMKKFISE